MFELKNKDYLKNGKNFVQWDERLAFLIFSEGYMYKNLTELFKALSEETKLISKEKKKWLKKLKSGITLKFYVLFFQTCTTKRFLVYLIGSSFLITSFFLEHWKQVMLSFRF